MLAHASAHLHDSSPARMQDHVVTQAFGSDPLLTKGCDVLDCDWEMMWRSNLEAKGQGRLLRPDGGPHGSSFSTSVALEAYVVGIKDAGAPGSTGLLQPLLRRYQARGCSISAFGLPAVEAVISNKWTTWAARFLVYELLFYAVRDQDIFSSFRLLISVQQAWLGSFATFSLLIDGEDTSLTLQQLLQSNRGQTSVYFSVTSFLTMLPFFYMEVRWIICCDRQ